MNLKEMNEGLGKGTLTAGSVIPLVEAPVVICHDQKKKPGTGSGGGAYESKTQYIVLEDAGLRVGVNLWGLDAIPGGVKGKTIKIINGTLDKDKENRYGILVKTDGGWECEGLLRDKPSAGQGSGPGLSGSDGGQPVQQEGDAKPGLSGKNGGQAEPEAGRTGEDVVEPRSLYDDFDPYLFSELIGKSIGHANDTAKPDETTEAILERARKYENYMIERLEDHVRAAQAKALGNGPEAKPETAGLSNAG